MVTLMDLNSALPANLAAEALDVAVLQDGLLRVEEFQQQTRAGLFKKVAHVMLTEPEAAFEQAVDQVCQVSRYFTADTPEATFAQHAQQYRDVVTQEQQLLEADAARKADQDVQDQLQEFHSLLQQGHLSEAAWCLVRLRKTAQESQQRGETDGVVAAHMTPLMIANLSSARHHAQQCSACELQMQQLVDHCLSQLIQLSPPGSSPAPQGSLHLQGSVVLSGARAAQPAWPDSVTSPEVWGALQVLGQQQHHLEQLTGTLLSILKPMLLGEAVCEVRVHKSGAGGVQTGGAEINWRPAPHPPHPQQPEVPEPEDTRTDTCRQVLNATAVALFNLDEGLIRGLGDAAWTPFTHLFVSCYVQPAAAAASAAGRGAALHALVQAAGDLEDWAVNMGYVEGGSLHACVSDAVCELEAQQQVAPLETARAALLADLKGDSAPVVVGSELAVDAGMYERLMGGQCPDWELSDPACGVLPDAPLLSRGQYRVGPGAVQVALLVEQVLQQAYTSGAPATAAALVHSLRKIALLARSLASCDPSIRHQLASVLPLALLHHNTLIHLADTFLQLSPVYGPLLEPLLGDSLGLVEPSLLMRAAGQQVLAAQVSSQLDVFRELMSSGFKGFRHLGGSSNAQAGITYRKTMSQVLHTLGRLGRALVDHLRPDALTQVAAQVLGGVCASIVSDISHKSDIGIDDCKELREVLGPLAQQGPTALLPAPNSGRPGQQDDPSALLSGVPISVLREVVVCSCAPLRQLRMLLRLLDAGMKDVVAAWEKRQLQECGFSADDVIHLLCALFEASEYRKDAVARIRASAW